MADDHSPGLTTFFQNAAKLPLLKPHEEVELAKRIEQGDLAAKQKMVEHNIRLAISIAKNYRNRGVPFEDLVQEGMLGLLRAATKFDWRRGHHFSTYATWWVKHFVQRAVTNTSSTIRVPGQILIWNIKMQAYLHEHPDASNEELAKSAGCREDQVDHILGMSKVVASIDTMVGEGESAHERIADPNAIMPGDADVIMHQRIREAVATLPDDERVLVELSYGFNGPTILNRDDIAEHMGIETHRIAHIRAAALLRLAAALDTIVADGGGTSEEDRHGATSSSHRVPDIRPTPVTCRRKEPVPC